MFLLLSHKLVEPWKVLESFLRIIVPAQDAEPQVLDGYLAVHLPVHPKVGDVLSQPASDEQENI